MHKNKILTFASLYDAERTASSSSKVKTIKADRCVLQRLIIAYESGRSVNIDKILCHELLPVPLALTQMNGDLRTGTKSILCDALTADVPCPHALNPDELGDSPSIIIDGQALVCAIGKPKEAGTFGDLFCVFRSTDLNVGASFNQIHVIFDRYYKVSIKSGTRMRRTRGNRPIRRVIENGDVPLPSDWNNFLASAENKEDLARFLSEQLVGQEQVKTIIVAGGFVEEQEVKSTDLSIDTTPFEAVQEEADTRIILHCVQDKTDSAVVQARDTDILVLLIAHFNKMAYRRLWFKAGTSKKRKYIPIHSIVEQMPYGPTVLETLPAFHALTGSDVTSFLSGHSKKTAWKVFEQHHELLKDLGKGNLAKETIAETEQFVCRLYNTQDVTTVDKARSQLFMKSRAPESLPPTSDALSFHIMRSHYQATVWRQAHVNYPDIPPPQDMGWEEEDGKILPVLMSLPPVPEACLELISCGCTTACVNARCKCRKSRLPCTMQCKCKTGDHLCRNN